MTSPLEATVRRGFAKRRRNPAHHAVRLHPPRFGRSRSRLLAAQPVEPAIERKGWGLSDDARLYAQTFAAGFLFVSILIG
ncbi:hypothetical protein H8M03_01075 [Sphingomonas sabuli]|uniref:Uncharacterized protein n=1 Tax=Sphingomonas sabuli TaxID=2764186 RepID=A0A7G9L2Y9_9SPHN|nr:hypothetical protein [Sphingomonas sabuli]QNM82988.1 hypothetical protein H8M03_01075 [Sphingomonas sabuli]